MKLVAVLILLTVAAVALGDPPTTQSSDKTVLTVAADGSGDFKTVQAAIDAVPVNSDHRITIHVLAGTYKERLMFPKNKPMIALLGDDAAKTVLTFDNTHNTNDPNDKPLGTSKSASTFIYGPDFVAEHITFEDSAGPVGQALAINIYADRAAFVDCRFLGWQDTVMTNQNRQYYRDCYLAGHVDFIFGGATVYFKNCEVHCRAGGSITAASTPQESKYGYVFDRCTVTSEAPAKSVVLGRPWRPYGATIFLNCQLADCISAVGWDDWGKSATARYAEYQSTGPGAAPEKRVKWTRQLTDAEAQDVTVANVLGGDNWDPESQISQITPLPGNEKK